MSPGQRSGRLPPWGTPKYSAMIERVRLVEWTREMERARLHHMTGVIEDTIGDEVLVRYGEIVVQVPAEMLVPTD